MSEYECSRLGFFPHLEPYKADSIGAAPTLQGAEKQKNRGLPDRGFSGSGL